MNLGGWAAPGRSRRSPATAYWILILPSLTLADVHSDCFDRQWGVTCDKTRVEDAKAADQAFAPVAAGEGWARGCYLVQYATDAKGPSSIVVSLKGKKGGTAPACLDVATQGPGLPSAALSRLAGRFRDALAGLPASARTTALRGVTEVYVTDGRGGDARAKIAPTAASSRVPGEPTSAQKIRAKYSVKDLAKIRSAAQEARSDNRWPADQQASYLKSREKTKAKDPSINRRTCECLLEVMMDKYDSFGDFVKERANGGGQPEDAMKTAFGICLAAFGD